MERGLRVADALALPTWVEASMAGHEMYKRCGFLDIESGYMKTKRWEIELRILRRPPPTVHDEVKTNGGLGVLVTNEQEIEEDKRK